jgi:DNA-binding protein Fis
MTRSDAEKAELWAELTEAKRLMASIFEHLNDGDTAGAYELLQEVERNNRAFVLQFALGIETRAERDTFIRAILQADESGCPGRDKDSVEFVAYLERLLRS